MELSYSRLLELFKSCRPGSTEKDSGETVLGKYSMNSFTYSPVEEDQKNWSWIETDTYTDAKPEGIKIDRSLCTNGEIVIIKDKERIAVVTDYFNSVPVCFEEAALSLGTTSKHKNILEFGKALLIAIERPSSSASEHEHKGGSNTVFSSTNQKARFTVSIIDRVCQDCDYNPSPSPSPSPSQTVSTTSTTSTITNTANPVSTNTTNTVSTNPVSTNPVSDTASARLEAILVCSLQSILGLDINTADASTQSGLAPVFISFSGGIDSLLCTLLVLKTYPQKNVFLINTVFSKTCQFVSKDREKSLQTYKYLEKEFGARIQYVENNVSRTEVILHKDSILSISGHSIMNFNLAALHYFNGKKAASLGGRVLLTGTGGDELFLGYSRHRGQTHASLLEMVHRDAKLFSTANLHRDYLAAAEHSVCLASPFLAHSVFLLALSHARPECIGKALLFRLIRTHLPHIALPKKLAGQFGSGISDTVRSIHCRAITRCPNNECFSLECTNAETENTFV
ncbi:hypothetical protein NECID01_0383 [Nematocida sp. AWRm77]|nr:hypothetical protein NECID01_0383 [Nematocida sp. AWRm77]